MKTRSVIVYLVWWVLIICLGVWGYNYSAIAPAHEPFPFGAFLAFVSGAVWTSIMRSGARGKWLWMLVPFVALGILSWEANKVAHSLAQDLSSELIRRYALWAFGILILALLWAWASPNEASFNLEPSMSRVPWHIIFVAAGCAVALFVGLEAAHCFKYLPTLPGSDHLRILQESLARAGLAVYFFVAARALLPRTIVELTGGWPTLPRGTSVPSCDG